MRSVENVNNKDMPERLKKCLSCTHACTNVNDDMEIECRCKTGCNYKAYKNKENKVRCQ